jgi:branched-chain amino acid transport system permease protein
MSVMHEASPHLPVTPVHRQRARQIGILAAIAVIYLLILPLSFAHSSYILGVLTNASMLSFISLGVWTTFSIGRINISQGAFALVGGYTTAILITRYGVPFWICLPLSGLVAALVGAVIGAAILRLRGVYFAMITLSMTEAMRLAVLNGGSFTQGATGITNIPRPQGLSIAGITLLPDFSGSSPLAFYYFAAILLLLGVAAVYRLSTSRLGWVFRSIRQNEELASSIGINVAKYRVMAYGICCFLGGVGGSFFAIYFQNIYPATYTVTDSIYFMLYCFLGGLDVVYGPVIGAFLLVTSFELLHGVQEYQALIYGVLMISCMLWLPNGIASFRLRPRKSAPRRVHPPAAPAGGSAR